MKILYSIEDLKKSFNQCPMKDQRIAMVPTMGALHEGHVSLIKRAREENDILIVSIFVNPIQFGPGEDYEAYPRDLKKDADLCRNLGVDYIFHPDEKEMYPENFATFIRPPEAMTNILCGASRPGHFQGVLTVLCKFFSLIHPHRAYFGKKDIQQLAVVKRMVEDLNLGVEIIGCPIVREEDGLAKSSRNAYLNLEERKAAPILRRAILKGVHSYEQGERDPEKIQTLIREEIEKERLAKIDYIEILDFESFNPSKYMGENTLIALAVYIGKTRLIDNTLL